MKNNEINGHYSRIEKSTIVKGDIVSEGDFRIDGNLFVSEALSLRSTSVIDGDVVIGKLIVESGATFNASCSMNKEGKKADFKLVKKPDDNHEKTA